MGRGPKPSKGKAKPAVAGKSPKNEDPKVRDLEKRLAESLEREKATGRALTEALEQQTGTSEILRIIASSPTDAQPVFETIVRSAVILSGANYGTVVRFDGDLMHLAAGYNYTPEVAQP